MSKKIKLQLGDKQPTLYFFGDGFINKAGLIEMLVTKSEPILRKYVERFDIQKNGPNKSYQISSVVRAILECQKMVDENLGREPISRDDQQGLYNKMLDRRGMGELLTTDHYAVWRNFVDVTGIPLYPKNPFNPNSRLELCSWLDFQKAMQVYKEKMLA